MDRSAAAGDVVRAAREAREALERLLDELPELRAALPRTFGDGAEAYVRLLLGANERLNLTRIVEPVEVARLHLLDALVALPLLDAAGAERVVDVGSGGGVPALPLALARPDAEWVMVESVRKKAATLEAFATALGLRRVRVVAERAEVVGRDPAHRERYGVATARALASLPVLAELVLPLVAVGGRALAWKGPLAEDADEVRRGRAAAGQLGAGRLRIVPAGAPSLGGHTIVVLPKAGPTAARFPRRPGEASRRPLG